MTENKDSSTKETPEVTAVVKFCPICGSKMYQGMRYGFLCWICPECDYDEPI